MAVGSASFYAHEGKPADLYRRLARRVRSQHAGDLHAKQVSLAALARSADEHAGIPQPQGHPLVGTPYEDNQAALILARSVSQSMEGGSLRYSRRRRLLRQGKSLGLADFEIHLIIALVRQRATPLDKAANRTSTIRPWKKMLLGIAMIQLIISAAIMAIVL